MTGPPSVYLDTSALFAAVWSPEGGGRLILTLGELGAVQILISPQVLAEMEGALRRKAPRSLASLAILLDRARVETTEHADPAVIAELQALIGHHGDAAVMAAALTASPEYFVTLDRAHFLDNETLLERLPFPIGTPGDFIAWYRGRYAAP